MSRALAAGQAPKVQSYLNAIDDLLRAAGVRHFNARELTALRKVPGVYAIPPREYWPRLAALSVNVLEPLRVRMGVPLRILNGYRPSDYNKAVGGAARSSHLWGYAADVTCGDADADGDIDSADRALLRAAAADMFVSMPSAKIGFGFYAGNIHAEWGRRRIAYASPGSDLDERELEAARARSLR